MNIDQWAGSFVSVEYVNYLIFVDNLKIVCEVWQLSRVKK